MILIKQRFIKFNFTKRNEKPKYIVIHDTDNPGLDAEYHYNYFNSENKNASADFFVDSKQIIQTVDRDVNYSWHCGDGHGKYGITNQNSLGIEICIEKDGNPTEATLQSTLELIKFLMKKYNISINNVVRHYDASRKKCPKSFMKNNWCKWYEFKRTLCNS